MADNPAYLDRWMNRAEKAVGVVTLLVSIAVFGIGSLCLGLIKGSFCALIAFGLIGALEVFHIQTEAKLKQRGKAPQVDRLYTNILSSHPTWSPEVLRKFNHGGILFRVLGFKELQVPLAVSQPLCPACEHNAIERFKTVFPGRFRIHHFCPCGFTHLSKQTLAELRQEAERIANTPG